MAIISVKFLYFVLISLAIYYLLPGKLQNIFILLASYYFYSTWVWWYAPILLVITIFNFYYAQIIQRAQNHRGFIVWLGVGFNSSLYVFFLIANLYSKQLNHLTSTLGITIAILVPIGLGYRVLECISYLLDIKLKIAHPASNFIDFALYLAYFPKLISGPIERARKFLPQLSSKKEITNKDLSHSILLILVGMGQTVVLAGMLSVLTPVSPLKRPQDHTNLELIVGLLYFAFYLYNQFAGYTNIVRGISGLFGVELNRNFAFPLFSKNFADFWKRWHISLSQWLRDYVYLPLSRAFLRRNPKRTNKTNLVVPPLVTMLVSGIWHGASPNLLVWGALNGIYIVAENIRSLYRPTTPSLKKPFWKQLLSSLIVVGLALFAGIPFSMSLATSKIFLYQMVFAWSKQIPDLRPLVIMVFSILLEWSQYRSNDEFIFLKWPGWLQSLATVMVIVGVIIVTNLQSVPVAFVYP